MILNHQQTRIQRAIWIYLACVAFLTFFAWIPYLIHWPASGYFPLSHFRERFGDLANFASVHQKLANPDLENFDHLAGTMFPRNYGPLAILIYLFLLGVCSPYGVVVFLLIFIGALTFASYLLWRAARRSPGYRPFMAVAIFGTSLLAYPTAETEMRGNIEGLLWIGYAAGIGYMFLRKWAKSASVLAVASCTKPYPLFLFVILLWRRKYKEIALGCAVLFVTTIGCLTLLGKGNALQGFHRIRASSAEFFANYIVGFRDVREIVADQSLFQTSKSVARVLKARSLHLPPENYTLQRSTRTGYILLAIYLPFAAISVTLVVFKIRNKPFLNQVFSLSICLTLFPLMAAVYTLTILYLPMGLFLLFLLRDVSTGRASIPQTRLLSILLLCASLMAPVPILRMFAGDVRSMVLLCLLFLVINTPMPMAIDLPPSAGGREMVEAKQIDLMK